MSHPLQADIKRFQETHERTVYALSVELDRLHDALQEREATTQTALSCLAKERRQWEAERAEMGATIDKLRTSLDEAHVTVARLTRRSDGPLGLRVRDVLGNMPDAAETYARNLSSINPTAPHSEPPLVTALSPDVIAAALAAEPPPKPERCCRHCKGTGEVGCDMGDEWSNRGVCGMCGGRGVVEIDSTSNAAADTIGARPTQNATELRVGEANEGGDGANPRPASDTQESGESGTTSLPGDSDMASIMDRVAAGDLRPDRTFIHKGMSVDEYVVPDGPSNRRLIWVRAGGFPTTVGEGGKRQPLFHCTYDPSFDPTAKEAAREDVQREFEKHYSDEVGRFDAVNAAAQAGGSGIAKPRVVGSVE